MNISPEERDNAIEAILSKGLTPPVPTWAFLRDMCKSLGPRAIFWDFAPGILVSVMVAAGYVALGIMPLAWIDDWINMPLSLYSSLFLLSPALFIGLTISTEAIERLDGLYDLKMTCRYTIRQIMAFRLLSFSLCGTIFTVVGSAAISSMPETGCFMQLFSLALCSLFLCSLLIIHTMRRLHCGWYLGAAIWTGVGLLPIIIFRQAWENLLSHIPPAITLCVAAVAFLLFLREIKIAVQTTREVYSYANSG